MGLVVAAMFMFGMPNVQAQDDDLRHELSVTFQGVGLGSMPFHGDVSWNDQPGLSLGAGVGYTFWFNEHVGIRTGLRFNSMKYNQKVTNYNVPLTATLPLSSIGLPGGSGTTTVNLQASATSIQEEQHYNFIELPLQLALQFHRVYFNLGASVAKAVNASADYSYTNAAFNMTELPDLSISMNPPVPMTLSGEAEGSIKNADMVKPLLFLLDAEMGYKIRLSDVTSIGVGLYGRYAPIPYTNADAVEAYGIQSDATYALAQPSVSTLAERIGYYEVGVSLGVNFGLVDKKRKQCEAELLAMRQTADVCAGNLAQERRLRAESEKAREKAEADLAAERAARQQAEADLAAERAARQQAENAERNARAAAQDARAAAQDARAAAQAAQLQSQMLSIEAQKARAEAQKKLEAIGATVYFANAGTDARFDSKTDDAIHAICDAMKTDNTLVVTVYGHTDNTGSAQTNMKYGQKRAEALKNYMVKLGAPAANIKCESKGQNEPVADNSTEEGRAKNRRATVELK